MKTIITMLLLLVVSITLYAQIPARFSKDYMYQPNDTFLQSNYTQCVASLNNGGYILPSTYYIKKPGFLYNFLITILDKQGSVINTKVYADTTDIGSFNPLVIKKLIDGNYLIGGRFYYYTFHNKNRNYCAMIAKVTPNGDTLFTQKFATGPASTIFDIIENPNKTIVLFGNTEAGLAPGSLKKDLVIKTDSLGNETWKYQYGQALHYSSISNAVPTNDSSYLVLSYDEAQGSPYASTVVYKMDTTGSVLWKNIYTSTNTELGVKIIKTKNEDFLIIGNTSISNKGRGLLLKIDTAGTVLWKKTYTSTYNDINFTDATLALNSNLLIAGTEDTLFYDTNGGQHRIAEQFIIRLSQDGQDTVWLKRYPTSSADSAAYSGRGFYKIYATPDNGAIALGSYGRQNFVNTSHYYIWLHKMDSLGCADSAGCISTVGVREVSNIQPQSGGVISVSPNPFAYTAQVQVYTSSAVATLQLTNTLGIVVHTYILQEGDNTITLYKNNMPAGMYYCTLREQGKIVQVQKIVVSE